ncbi:hypothetical protein K438DRAFT_1871411 [Mycena galopus ATCC 62051]|nr:hypothetical protein K438DRAFT_1871411 [Mycena galopus ATCC 62051]
MSVPPSLPPIPPNIASITAPLIIGELLGSYLFGVLTVQFYIYHVEFPKDRKLIKSLVYTVFLLDLVETAMGFADTYHWFASGFGNPFALNNLWLSGFEGPMIGSVLAAIVQCFYCYRMWTLNRYTAPICIIVILAAIAQVAAGIYGALLGHTFSDITATGRIAGYIADGAAAFVDVLIAVSMTILLLRSRTRYAKTDFIVKKIITLIVETNLLSSILALLALILLAGLPGTLYFTCPSMILGKIYSNSLLLMLNNRKYLSDNLNSVTGTGSDESNGLNFRLAKFRAASRTSESTAQHITLQSTSQSTIVVSKNPQESV